MLAVSGLSALGDLYAGADVTSARSQMAVFGSQRAAQSERCATVDGGVNPRINGDDRKAGTRFAACDQPLLAIYRSDANGCPVALCQRRQPPKAGAVGQRCVLGMSSSLGVKVPCAT